MSANIVSQHSLTMPETMLIDAERSDLHCEAARILESVLPRAFHLFLASGKIAYRILASGERYYDASPSLQKLHIDPDAHPVTPAGAFVVDDRTIYLRSVNRYTLIHETMHAIDFVFGDNRYWSYSNKEIDERYMYAFNKDRFVSPYARAGLDEFFAESGFAYFDSPESKKRLSRLDKKLFACLENVFSSIEARVLSEAS